MDASFPRGVSWLTIMLGACKVKPPAFRLDDLDYCWEGVRSKTGNEQWPISAILGLLTRCPVAYVPLWVARDIGISDSLP